MSNSVFVTALKGSEGSIFKDNCVKSNIHRPMLSAAKMLVNKSSSFWQYKLFVDIRRLFSGNCRQTGLVRVWQLCYF